jgi:hypothetical protein
MAQQTCFSLQNKERKMSIVTIVSFFPSFFLNRPLLPCCAEGFLLVNLLDKW